MQTARAGEVFYLDLSQKRFELKAGLISENLIFDRINRYLHCTELGKIQIVQKALCLFGINYLRLSLRDFQKSVDFGIVLQFKFFNLLYKLQVATCSNFLICDFLSSANF